MQPKKKQPGAIDPGHCCNVALLLVLWLMVTFTAGVALGYRGAEAAWSLWAQCRNFST